MVLRRAGGGGARIVAGGPLHRCSVPATNPCTAGSRTVQVHKPKYVSTPSAPRNPAGPNRGAHALPSGALLCYDHPHYGWVRRRRGHGACCARCACAAGPAASGARQLCGSRGKLPCAQQRGRLSYCSGTCAVVGGESNPFSPQRPASTASGCPAGSTRPHLEEYPPSVQTFLGKAVVLAMICLGVVAIPVQAAQVYTELSARRVVLGECFFFGGGGYSF